MTLVSLQGLTLSNENSHMLNAFPISYSCHRLYLTASGLHECSVLQPATVRMYGPKRKVL